MLDALNLKKEDIEVKKMPKIHIHANMSTEQIMERIDFLMQDLGIAREDKDAFILAMKQVENKQLENK